MTFATETCRGRLDTLVDAAKLAVLRQVGEGREAGDLVAGVSSELGLQRTISALALARLVCEGALARRRGFVFPTA